MRVLRVRNVTVYLSEDVYAWPAHRDEILGKMDELAELLYSLETGQTERQMTYKQIFDILALSKNIK